MTPWIAFATQLVPIIAGYIRDFKSRNGVEPTDDEVNQWLQNDADAVEAVSKAWLAAHGSI